MSVSVGHVHLKVSDLERAVAFYTEALGFQVTQRMGDSAAFLSAGGYHHHLGLNTWESRDGAPPARGSTGLYHAAFLYPDRRSLAAALRRLLAHGVALDGAADHGVSEALYLRDPDGNGVELYRDRAREEWPRAADGSLQMFTRPLDTAGLLAEAEAIADEATKFTNIMPELPVDDVASAIEHYRDVLGFTVNHAAAHIGVMDRDDARLLLVARTGGHTGIGSCYVYVRDADVLHRELVAAGADVRGEPVSRPWGLREFEVFDPEGNRLRFGEPL